MRFLALFISSIFFISGFAACNQQSKNTYGYIENVTLVQQNLTLPAKLDTGAKTASLNAVNIKKIKKNGEYFIQFDVPTEKENIRFYGKYAGKVQIKLRSGEQNAFKTNEKTITRPMVYLDIKLGDMTRKIRVNLTNRQHFIYPLLLGREAIKAFCAIIDPAKKDTLEQAA